MADAQKHPLSFGIYKACERQPIGPVRRGCAAKKVDKMGSPFAAELVDGIDPALGDGLVVEFAQRDAALGGNVAQVGQLLGRCGLGRALGERGGSPGRQWEPLEAARARAAGQFGLDATPDEIEGVVDAPVQFLGGETLGDLDLDRCLAAPRDGRNAPSWESGAKVISGTNRTAWIIEASVPLRALGGFVAIGDLWRVNVVRDNPSDGEASTWVPLDEHKWHVPGQFSPMKFSDRTPGLRFGFAQTSADGEEFEFEVSGSGVGTQQRVQCVECRAGGIPSGPAGSL